MFVNEPFDVEKFEEFFPYMEEVFKFGSYFVNLEKNEVKWSLGMYKILAVEPGKLTSNPESFHQFIVPEDRALCIEKIKYSIENREPYEMEFSLIDALGNFKRLSAKNFLKFNAENKLINYNGLIKDITEKFMRQQELEAQIKLLDKSNQNLQEFVYVASHDLQEPLRKIAVFSDRLQSKFGTVLGTEGQNYLQRIINSGKGMQVLLEDLIDFSRLSFVEKIYTRTSLTAIVEDALHDLEMKIEESGATVKFSELPTLEVYPSQLKQLVMNLILNSIKFRKKDQPLRIEIKGKSVSQEDFPALSLQENTTYVQLDFSDNGIGFDQAFAERIFIVFQRLHGKVEYSGSGIGLSICKKIVENHNGFIFAQGESQIGATFTVLLPQNHSEA
jgi:light-regulated signal transduction histidine kinase (bacteriophytochrome)